jgi:hypothetical protein
VVGAVQAQPGPAVTATLPAPPAAGAVAAVGRIEYAQPAAAWVKVKVWPAMVSVPVRFVVTLLAATE